MKRLAVLLLVVVVAGCRCQKDTVSPTNPAAVLEGNWELEYVAGSSVPFDTLYPGARPNASLDLTAATIAGRNGCNNYSGNLKVEGSRFVADRSSMISTRMFCEGGGEEAYMNALGRVDSYAVANGKLELKSGSEVVLRFHKKQ